MLIQKGLQKCDPFFIGYNIESIILTLKMMKMKTTIKKLANAINEELAKNCKANYYSGLFDGGEWSQKEPDFTKLIQNWHLNRRRLCLWTWIAWDYAEEFDKHYPKRTRGYDSKKGPYDPNPWRDIAETLQNIFIAGFLNNRKEGA